MRRKPGWRYYCDHCAKSGAGGGAMARHERSCTRNPNRVCRMCEMGGKSNVPIAELIAALRSGGLDAVRSLAGTCPACILAAILQDRIARGVNLKAVPPRDDKTGRQEHEAEYRRYADFDFKKERDAYFAHVNETRWGNVGF